jgi:DNA-binding transcriptional MerR regulator/uncharacterized cupin superfamily protein
VLFIFGKGFYKPPAIATHFWVTNQVYCWCASDKDNAMNTDSPSTNGSEASGKTLKISDLSRLTGIPVSTLRYWCDQHLLTPFLTPAGHRHFEQHHVAEALSIQRLRKVQGLNIAAVKSTLPAPNLAPEPVNTGSTVGDQLRRRRLQAKLTLRELSRQTGIGKSVLASIERTSLGVNIPEAKELAKYYGLTLTELMTDDIEHTAQPLVTPTSGGPLQPTLGTGLRIEQMASGRGMMDCQRWYIEPGINSHGAYEHDGEEFIYVLFGQFQIAIENDDQYLLGQGESIYFASSLKHSWSNPGRTTTILLWVNTPPTF